MEIYNKKILGDLDFVNATAIRRCLDLWQKIRKMLSGLSGGRDLASVSIKSLVLVNAWSRICNHFY